MALKQTKTSFWTRQLELELIRFVKQRPFIWKSCGNTNNDIQNKYRAYAEFAAKLGRGFTARSVRDRWVNLRSTFHQNLRKVNRSKAAATCPREVYTPCWPLWGPLQFLDTSKEENIEEEPRDIPTTSSNMDEDDILKEESNSEVLSSLRHKPKSTSRQMKWRKDGKTKCEQLLGDLVTAMKPLDSSVDDKISSYWYFGRHVTSRLNAMDPHSAFGARQEILQLLYDSDTENKNGDSLIKTEDI